VTSQHQQYQELSREEQVLARIEKARARKAKLKEERITLSHGSGGKATQTLIEAVFLEAFSNPLLAPLEDGAVLPVHGGRLAFTTDSYVVSPLFFPGGDIGDLAVNGTVNDLAVSGARPLWLSAGFILEEGFPVADLERIVGSMAAAAERAGVQVVTGDTKVVQRGKADGCYVNTAGVRQQRLVVALRQPLVGEGGGEQLLDELRHGPPAGAVRQVDAAVADVERAHVAVAHAAHWACSVSRKRP
jgi:hydrogenase expression/formation protein HypE